MEKVDHAKTFDWLDWIGQVEVNIKCSILLLAVLFLFATMGYLAFPLNEANEWLAISLIVAFITIFGVLAVNLWVSGMRAVNECRRLKGQ